MFNFTIDQRLDGKLGRTGVIATPHGEIKTPAFIAVGTKATVKALTPEQTKDTGIQAVLGNTYHLYLEPGEALIKQAGGLHRFMNWPGPIMTDSGGFQVFSLGAAFGRGISKILKRDTNISDTNPPRRMNRNEEEIGKEEFPKLAKVDEDGVTFRSHIDGSEHRFTPERSIEIQHNLGADIIFAFDECTSPTADHDYQEIALERTQRWAERSLAEHQKLGSKQALFGIVQGGRFKDLREAGAKYVASLDFSGFGIGGSFEKKDIDTAVGWVNAILPEEKPRHLLGIGEPEDMLAAIEQGIDTFDCVTPTRLGRMGHLYAATGKINIRNARFREDLSPLEADCGCHTCRHYTRAYLAHLFRANEMLGATLATIHNLRFMTRLTDGARQAIERGRWPDFKEKFLAGYLSS